MNALGFPLFLHDFTFTLRLLHHFVFTLMQCVVVAAAAQIEMDRHGSLQGQASSPSTRVERKTLEKNRRNKMKHLYCKLSSLLPKQNPKEPKSTLPDQIDDAVNHIRCLEASIKESKEKKETLLSKKRLHSRSEECSRRTNNLQTFVPPKIEVNVRGCSIEVTAVTAVSDQFIFTDILRILHQEKSEVHSANFSVNGSSVYHLIHAQIGEYGDGGVTITEKLKELVNGSPDLYYKEPAELQQDTLMWNDFESGLDLWVFDRMPGYSYN